MRYALIADIHGNLPAFKALIQDIEGQNVDKFIFAGDYWGDLPYPNEVVSIIRGMDNAYAVSGNKEGYLVHLKGNPEKNWKHKQYNCLYWNYDELEEANLQYLIDLPEEMRVNLEDGKSIHLIHSITDLFKDTKLSSMRSSSYRKIVEAPDYAHESFGGFAKELIEKDNDLCEKIEAFPSDLIIFGHTHIQWHARVRGKVLINPGSCGMPLDLQPSAAYALLDIQGDDIKVSERRVQYDIDGLISEAKSFGLYKVAKGWSEAVFEQLTYAGEQVYFFLKHVRKVGLEHGEDEFCLLYTSDAADE